MLQLLHTLYITESDSALHLEGQCLRVLHSSGQEDHVPLHLLNSIVTFSHGTITQNVMAACAKRGIGLFVLSQNGKFRFQIQGESHGNACLRKRQYMLTEQERLPLASAMLRGKIEHQAFLLAKGRRNHPESGSALLQTAEKMLRDIAQTLAEKTNSGELRGVEGQASKIYFSAFPNLIRTGEETFYFHGRNRRPLKDKCNAMLSFAYTMLMYECLHALESVGLDPCIGMLHGVRAGRPALALDLMEEFRPVMAERLVLHLINLRMVKPEMFETAEDGGIYFDREGKKIFLREWNRMKQRELWVPSLEKNIPIGVLPYLQALRLSRYLREEESAFSVIDWR